MHTNRGIPKRTANQAAGNDSRTVRLLRAILLILICLGGLLAFSIWYNFGFTISFFIALFTSLFFAAMLVLVNLRQIFLSRLLVCIFLPIYTLCAAVFIKATELTPIQESEYFDSRLILLVSVALPLVLFKIRERIALMACLLLSFVALLLYDPLHNFFGLGYYQQGLQSPNYPFVGFIVVIMFILLSSTILYFKVLFERTEEQLLIQNLQLQKQHVEIIQQSAHLKNKQEALEIANKQISKQKALLEQENDSLYQSLLNKNELLKNSNTQLNRQVKALRQYSYTLSHNLRGPVASLLGALSLLSDDQPKSDDRELIGYAKQSAKSLDQVIRDLSDLLQDNEEQEVEEIQLERLLKDIWQSLQQEYRSTNNALVLALEVDTVESVKPYLYSILYNLLSNGLKYHKKDEVACLRVSSEKQEQAVLITVQDNGIGIDLEKHHNDLFKMYKRFSTERDGRGLGLFLVKSQVEEIGGTIDLESKPGEGTTFTIWLPQSEQL